ncbi:hypothetical protein OG21DRAFT_959906 [Imleria badia]|nr:hypothetical protein OG21DRAFT_959906 [Imleria badia]
MDTDQRMPPLGTPLADSKFSLNSAGVAGFFGGKEAISAMATVHLYRGRRWLGWYNSPGSYTIAKRFGRMANSRFWDGLFPGPNDSPAVSFGLDGKKGPQYTAALSGTTMHTRHLAHLTMERSKEVEAEEIKGRVTNSFDVAYLAMKHVDYDTPIKPLPPNNALFGLIPITTSVVTCLMCALVFDWYSCSMILIGIISSGLASLVIGKGKLVITSVKNPAAGVPPGHGILMGEDEVVVIKGEERDVNAITKGRYDLKTHSKQGDLEKGAVRSYHAIGLCSLLLLLQFLLQLLLVPQGMLFGQIMFLVSLGVSWGYSSYLSSLEKEKIQADILFETLGNPEMLRFCAGTRTTMAVFVCLLVFHGVKRSSPEEDRASRIKIICSCLANDTPAWGRWREKVVQQLLNIDDGSDSLPYLAEDEEDRALLESERKLLKVLLEDAGAAFRGYLRVRDRLPDDSSHQKVEIK